MFCKNITALGILFAAVFFTAMGSETLIKDHRSETIGGATLNKETMFADSRGVGRAYYITVEKDGNYFVSLVTNGVSGKEYGVTVDNQSIIEGKVQLSDGWQAGFVVATSLAAAPKSIRLSKGDHVISFTGKDPEAPFIERIRIAKSEADAQLSAQDLIAMTKNLASKTMPADYLVKKANGTLDLTQVATASPPSDPLYKYQGITDVSFNYSLCWNVFLTAGQSKTYQTKNSTIDPVMYIFLENNPQSYSWSDDDGGGGRESKISFTAPITGVYTGVLRSYLSGYLGTGDLWSDGQLLQSGVVISGTMVAVYSYTSPGGELNFFTAKPGQYTGGSTYDTRLFTMPGYTSAISGYNDDYYGSGDFSWGRLSRIKKTLSQEVQYCLITSYYAGYSSTCDVYAKCSNGSFNGLSFPNLKADDAIKAADATLNYNCYAWSGGTTAEWIVPQTDPRWNTSGNDLTAFDNYYGNTPMRYTGAITYLPHVVTSTAGTEIDLWATGSGQFTSYQHTSVIKPANDQMHGYGYESKLANDMRIFHPRNALTPGIYGAAVWSYKRAGTLTAAQQTQITGVDQTAIPECALTAKSKALGIICPLTLDSSVALGLTVMRNVSFSDAETNKNSALITDIPSALKDEFTIKYSAWQKTWADPKIAYFSDPREFAKSAEYNSLKDFFLKQGKKIWPLLFAKAQEKCPFIQNLINDALQDAAVYEKKAVDLEFSGEQFTNDGAFIYTSNKDRRVALCKKLLKNF